MPNLHSSALSDVEQQRKLLARELGLQDKIFSPIKTNLFNEEEAKEQIASAIGVNKTDYITEYTQEKRGLFLNQLGNVIEKIQEWADNNQLGNNSIFTDLKNKLRAQDYTTTYKPTDFSGIKRQLGEYLVYLHQENIPLEKRKQKLIFLKHEMSGGEAEDASQNIHRVVCAPGLRSHIINAHISLNNEESISSWIQQRITNEIEILASTKSAKYKITAIEEIHFSNRLKTIAAQAGFPFLDNNKILESPDPFFSRTEIKKEDLDHLYLKLKNVLNPITLAADFYHELTLKITDFSKLLDVPYQNDKNHIIFNISYDDYSKYDALRKEVLKLIHHLFGCPDDEIEKCFETTEDENGELRPAINHETLKKLSLKTLKEKYFTSDFKLEFSDLPDATKKANELTQNSLIAFWKTYPFLIKTSAARIIRAEKEKWIEFATSVPHAISLLKEVTSKEFCRDFLNGYEQVIAQKALDRTEEIRVVKSIFPNIQWGQAIESYLEKTPLITDKNFLFELIDNIADEKIKRQLLHHTEIEFSGSDIEHILHHFPNIINADLPTLYDAINNPEKENLAQLIPNESILNLLTVLKIKYPKLYHDINIADEGDSYQYVPSHAFCQLIARILPHVPESIQRKILEEFNLLKELPFKGFRISSSEYSINFAITMEGRRNIFARLPATLQIENFSAFPIYGVTEGTLNALKPEVKIKYLEYVISSCRDNFLVEGHKDAYLERLKEIPENERYHLLIDVIGIDYIAKNIKDIAAFIALITELPRTDRLNFLRTFNSKNPILFSSHEGIQSILLLFPSENKLEIAWELAPKHNLSQRFLESMLRVLDVDFLRFLSNDLLANIEPIVLAEFFKKNYSQLHGSQEERNSFALRLIDALPSNQVLYFLPLYISLSNNTDLIEKVINKRCQAEPSHLIREEIDILTKDIPFTGPLRGGEQYKKFLTTFFVALSQKDNFTLLSDEFKCHLADCVKSVTQNSQPVLYSVFHHDPRLNKIVAEYVSEQLKLGHNENSEQTNKIAQLLPLKNPQNHLQRFLYFYSGNKDATARLYLFCLQNKTFEHLTQDLIKVKKLQEHYLLKFFSDDYQFDTPEEKDLDVAISLAKSLSPSKAEGVDAAQQNPEPADKSRSQRIGKIAQHLVEYYEQNGKENEANKLKTVYISKILSNYISFPKDIYLGTATKFANSLFLQYEDLRDPTQIALAHYLKQKDKPADKKIAASLLLYYLQNKHYRDAASLRDSILGHSSSRPLSQIGLFNKNNLCRGLKSELKDILLKWKEQESKTQEGWFRAPGRRP